MIRFRDFRVGEVVSIYGGPHDGKALCTALCTAVFTVVFTVVFSEGNREDHREGHPEGFTVALAMAFTVAFTVALYCGLHGGNTINDVLSASPAVSLHTASQLQLNQTVVNLARQQLERNYQRETAETLEAQRANEQFLRQFLDRPRRGPAPAVPSTYGLEAAASECAHEQKGGTCFAYSSATVLRAAEKRIVGRRVPSHEDWVRHIVRQFGNDGGRPSEVLAWACPPRRLRVMKVNAQNIPGIETKFLEGWLKFP